MSRRKCWKLSDTTIHVSIVCNASVVVDFILQEVITNSKVDKNVHEELKTGAHEKVLNNCTTSEAFTKRSHAQVPKVTNNIEDDLNVTSPAELFEQLS